MQRFISIALLVNWLAVMAGVGLSGLGMGEGLLPAGMHMLTALFGGNAFLAEPLVMAVALMINVAIVWAILAVSVAQPNGDGHSDAEFAVHASTGFCLVVFALVLLTAAFARAADVGALATVASFATVLTAVAWRFVAADEMAQDTKPVAESFSLTTARRMAAQSATISGNGSRLMPKRT